MRSCRPTYRREGLPASLSSGPGFEVFIQTRFQLEPCSRSHWLLATRWRGAKGGTFSIKKGAERKKGNGGRGRREEILPIWGKGQWTRHPCPNLTLRTDIIAWESAISRKQHSFFQDDFTRRAGGDDEMKKISRVARRTRRKDLVNNDRLMSPLPLSCACGGFHISDPSRE